jgi:nucleoside-diphosphate-sugar epimerase
MAEGDGKTVLVTGGSGYLGGWCIVELIRRGYRVRTTVRNPAREPEVHAAVASQVDLAHHLSIHQADLLSDEHWDNVIEGCDYVLHVASPFPPNQPKDADELIRPAREGTVRVLGKSLDHGAKRVVVTSSVAAVRLAGGSEKRPLNEDDWTDPGDTDLTPYVRSKTIAERAAWDLAKERGAEDRLAVINPGAIIGPVIHDDPSYSLQAIERLLNGMPGMPRLGFNFVDVRDVADLEILAMTAPEAGGKRFIAVTKWLWMSEAGEILRDRLGDRASKVPTRTLPDLLVRGMAVFDGGIRSIVGSLGKRTDLSAERAKSVLGWSPRPIDDTIAETAESLIELGVVEVPAAA